MRFLRSCLKSSAALPRSSSSSFNPRLKTQQRDWRRRNQPVAFSCPASCIGSDFCSWDFPALSGPAVNKFHLSRRHQLLFCFKTVRTSSSYICLAPCEAPSFSGVSSFPERQQRPVLSSECTCTATGSSLLTSFPFRNKNPSQPRPRNISSYSLSPLPPPFPGFPRRSLPPCSVCSSPFPVPLFSSPCRLSRPPSLAFSPHSSLHSSCARSSSLSSTQSLPLPRFSPSAASTRTMATAPSASSAPRRAERGTVQALSTAEKIGDPNFQICKDAPFIKRRLAIFSELYEKQQKALEEKPKTPIFIQLPDGSKKAGTSFVTSPFDVAMEISKGLAEASLIAKVEVLYSIMCSLFSPPSIQGYIRVYVPVHAGGSVLST